LPEGKQMQEDAAFHVKEGIEGPVKLIWLAEAIASIISHTLFFILTPTVNFWLAELDRLSSGIKKNKSKFYYL
jgi:hypothetical protein